MFDTTKRVFSDCLTSSSGDYDPARVVGYGVVVVGALEFLALTAYEAIKSNHFDTAQFAIGLAGIATTLAAAAAGVWIKNSTEPTPAPPEVKLE